MGVGIAVMWISGYEQRVQEIQQHMLAVYPDVEFGELGVVLETPDGYTAEEYRQRGAMWQRLKYDNIWGPSQQPMVDLITELG